MKGRQIVLDHLTIDGEQVEAAALMQDGVLSDLLIDDAEQPAPGTIYRAICDRPVKGQGGMFVKTPEGSGFLRQLRGMKPGQPVLVQVTGYPEPGKALPLTTKVLFKGRYAIVTPGAPGINISRSLKDDELRDELMVIAREVFGSHDASGGGAGLILRSACNGADPEDIAGEIAQLSDLAVQVLADQGDGPELLLDGASAFDLALRDWPEGELVQPGKVPLRSFEDSGVLDQLAELPGPVALAGGGHLHIEATRACISIDVNTGADSSPAAGLKANLAMAKDLPRQLRLRGLGGVIYLDLAPMGKKDRRQFETSLNAAFRADTTETVLAGWTPLGNFELQRKRDRLPRLAILAKLFG